MVSSAKLTKDTTLVIDDYYAITNDDRIRAVDLRLRPPHRIDYEKEETAIRFIGDKVTIDMDVLRKYGIDVEINGDYEVDKDYE